MWRYLCFGRNQDAGDCCFQGKDLGTIATRRQHRKGAHSADSGGVWHRKIPDGLQTNWRNQRYVVNSLWTDTSHLLNELTNNILYSPCLFYLQFDIWTYWHVFVDYIVVGSDSGRIVILEYHPSKNMFEKIHQETFGKSGCRRIVPGQFLAVDPKGRAVMIGMRKSELVKLRIFLCLSKLIRSLKYDRKCFIIDQKQQTKSANPYLKEAGQPTVVLPLFRCNRETEAGLHSEQRCCCKTDHLLSAGGP